MSQKKETNLSYTTKILLPIQSFLWRQSDSFFQQKIKKMYIETCKTFEHVVTKNEFAGLSPRFCDAVETITRWQFVEACLPHVMHCSALLLANRNVLGEGDKLGAASIKLLRTLHWIFLESFLECSASKNPNECSISLDNICLFIHLFAPVINYLKDSDLTYSLTSGQEIWRPMRNYDQPRIPSFMTTVTSSEKDEDTSKKIPKSFSHHKFSIASVPVTVCDVAVINCLLNERWCEEGVLWGINYLIKKLHLDSLTASEAKPLHRSRSLISRQKSSSFFKSVHCMPVQKESTVEKILEDSTKNLEDINKIFDDPKFQKKFAPLQKFWNKRYSQNFKKTKKNSPIEKRKQKIRSFAHLSLRKSRTILTKQNTSVQIRDDPPSYSAVASSSPFYKAKRKQRSKPVFEKIPSDTPSTSKDTKFSISPPKYAETITEAEDNIEILFSSVSPPAVSPEEAEPSQLKDSKELESKEDMMKRRCRSEASLQTKKNEAKTTSMASCKYVDDRGRLRLEVVLSVVDVIIGKSPSVRVLESSLQLLAAIHDRMETMAKDEHHKSSRLKSTEKDEKFTSEQSTCVMILVRILHNLTVMLGCTNGCSGHHGSSNERMRLKTRQLMTSLFLTQRNQYEKHIDNVMRTNSLKSIMDFLHSLLSYCVVDSNSVLVNEVTDESLFLDSQNTNKLDDYVVKITFRKLIMKCVKVQSELVTLGNEELYFEVRNVIQYVRINYPSTFNDVLLTVMLIPTRKRRKWEREQEKAKSNQAKGNEKSQNAAEDSHSGYLNKSFDSDTSDEEDLDFHGSGNEPKTRSKLNRMLRKTSNYATLPWGNKKTHRESTLTLASTIQEHLKPFVAISEPQQHNANEKKRAEFEVESKDICLGIKILQLLMDSCPPGTVPDPTILGSVMGLYSPVICRFVVLLHCAQFVERCTNRSWPRWLVNKSFQRRMSVKDVKEHYYNAARAHFFKWGVEVNKFLEKVIAISNDPCKVLGDVTKREDKVRNRNEDLNEDFLKDIRINSSGKECPIPLQMAASHLLYQITAFLKDTSSDMLVRKESCVSSEIGSKVEFNSASFCHSRHEENSSKKTIKFQSTTECLSQTMLSVPGSGLRRTGSLISGKHSSSKTDGRRGSGVTNVSEELKPSSSKFQLFPSRKPSMNTCCNTLAVPMGFGLGGSDQSGLSSCGDVSFGSTYSLGAASATSEYVKDMSDSAFSPNVCGGNSSTFCFDSSAVVDQSTKTKEFPWLKSMIQLANQQNFLCDHVFFCHPFCHKRMIRSCNRITETLKETFEENDKNTNEYLNEWDQLLKDYKDKSSRGEIRPSEIQLYSFLKTKARCLSRSPLLTLMKAVTSLSYEMLVDLHALCWEILLDSNKLLVEAAAALFLLCAIKIRSDVNKSVMAELNHNDPEQRICTLKKIRILWEYRSSVWKYAENQARENREAGFTFPAAITSFALSTSALGLGSSGLPDPPWIPHIVNVDELVARKGASTKSAALLTTDSLSSKMEQELKELLREEETEREEARRNYRFEHIPVVQQIVGEAKKKLGPEAEPDLCADSRRYSCRPVSTGGNLSNADFRKETICRSTRSSINHALRSSHCENANLENVPRPNSCVFPPSMGDCVPTIIKLIADVSTTNKGEQSVGAVASRVVLSCLNEDANLFIRSIAEKLLSKVDRCKALRLLRQLPSLLPDVSPSVANSFFNQVIECLIHYNRASHTKERIIAPTTLAMSSVLPFIESADLKTMKQTLRKEQIDMQLLITGGMQGTKKLTVWNQGEFYVPSQIDVSDASSFAHVLQEALKTSNAAIPESDYHLYQLVDKKNKQILCLHCHVRDFYMFKKSASNSASPEVTLVKMNPDESEKKLSHRVIELKLAEIGRLRFTIQSLFCQKKLTDREINATYLQDEFKKLWSFPRKAMDAEFFLFDGKYGKEIQGLDVVQKYYWVELISSIMLSLSSEFPWENDLIFFLHVWSAALVIHCMHAPILRRIMAAFIDVIVHFSRTFTFRGYSLILPSMLRVYSKHFHNKLIRQCLDLTFLQMLNVHREPFLLQLFASAAPLLAEYNWQVTTGGGKETELLSPKNFFYLLLTLSEQQPIDELHIMSSVKAEKPLKPADACLETEKEVKIGFGDYFRLCITAIAYQPENSRSLEMLVILNSVLPCYLQHIGNTLAADDEIYEIEEIGVCIRFLLTTVEVLTKSINFSSPTAPQAQQCTQVSHPTIQMIYNQSKRPSMKPSDRTFEDGKENMDSQENRQKIEEFIAPRDILLQLCTTYCKLAVTRFSQLNGPSSESIFNAKSLIRLAEISQSLLKLFSDENITTVSFGLASYVETMLPAVNWSTETVRPAIFLVLKRLDRFFSKNDKNFLFRKNHNWKPLIRILSGINNLLARQPIVSHISHLKGILNACITMQVGDANTPDDQAFHLPSAFTSEIMKLIVLYLQGCGDHMSLEDLVNPLMQKVKRDNIVLNLVIPICLCISTDLTNDAKNDFETKKNKLLMDLRTSDVLYMLNLCTNALMGKRRPTKQNVTQLLFSASPLPERHGLVGQRPLCLALKVVIACFHHKLNGKWHSLAKTLRDIIYQHITGPAIWKFVVFLMRYRTPLLASLKTFVIRKFLQRQAINVEEMEQKHILEEILQKRNHQTIQLSHIIKDFVEEAQELRKLLLSGNTMSENQTPKIAFGLPRLSNVSIETQEHDRSRKTSFRQAVTPHDSPDITKYGEEYKKQRTSLPVTRTRSRKNTPSPNRQSTRENAMQISKTVSVGCWSEIKSLPAVPDILIESCDPPNNAINSKSDQILLNSNNSITTLDSKSSTERNRRVTKSETTSFLSNSSNQLISCEKPSKDGDTMSNFSQLLGSSDGSLLE